MPVLKKKTTDAASQGCAATQDRMGVLPCSHNDVFGPSHIFMTLGVYKALRMVYLTFHYT